MAAKKDGKKLSLGQRAGGWFYRALFEKGWSRRLLVGMSLAAIICAVSILCLRSTYKDNPAYLVPPSVSTYLEVTDLDAVLRNAGSWQIWNDKRRERDGQLRLDIAGLLGARVAGLGTSLPLRWLSGTSRAAYCVTRLPGGGAETWALYLKMENPGVIVSEIVVEPGMTMEVLQERDGKGIFTLSDAKGGELYFAVAAPWLIISSHETLPRFALTSKPSITLATTGILPSFKAAPSLRGMIDPSSSPVSLRLAQGGVVHLGSWLEPQARVAFAAGFGNGGGLDATFSSVLFMDKPGGRGIWPFIWLLLELLGIVGVACLAVVLLNMARLGGWLKIKAARLGIVPARQPQFVASSPAFKEDTGQLESGADTNTEKITGDEATGFVMKVNENTEYPGDSRDLVKDVESGGTMMVQPDNRSASEGIAGNASEHVNPEQDS